LQRQEGLPVVLDELNLKVTDKKKLLASKYPIPVQQTLQLAQLERRAARELQIRRGQGRELSETLQPGIRPEH
jgi:hypothetical protein